MACSASFFSRNSVFVSQQFSRNSVFQPVSAKFQTSERGLSNDISNWQTIKETKPSLQGPSTPFARRASGIHTANFQRPLLSEHHHAFVLVPDGLPYLPWMLLLVHVAKMELYSSMNDESSFLDLEYSSPRGSMQFSTTSRFRFQINCQIPSIHGYVLHCCMSQ